MNVNFWLKINKSGAINVTKTEPYTTQNEIATQFSVTVPDAIFRKPRLSVSAKIGEGYKAPEITAEVATDIEGYIRTTTGLNLEVKIVQPEDSEETI